MPSGTEALEFWLFFWSSDLTWLRSRFKALAITNPLPNEIDRLEALCRYQLLDTPADGAFDRVTALAARHFRTPICLVSLLDEDRIWFKSRYGLDAQEILRTPGLCDRLLTVCAWTKQIRVGGEWLSFEKFIETTLGLKVSHGIHPGAASQLLDDRGDGDSGS